MNTRKDINRETFLFLWALAVCWWWMCSEKLGNFSHELFLQTTNMEVVGITGCIWFIYRSNSSLFNKSAISSYSRRRFTGQFSCKVLRWRVTFPLVLLSFELPRDTSPRWACLDPRRYADSHHAVSRSLALSVNPSRVSGDCAEKAIASKLCFIHST